MSAADPRPAVETYWVPVEIANYGWFVHADRSDDTRGIQIPARTKIAVDCEGISITLFGMGPDTARRLASAIVKAADDCEALDQWHLRNPHGSGGGL